MTYTTRVDGLDVSHYQGTVDWPTVRAHIAGPGLAAWKVTHGAITVDATATTNRQATAKAGFRWRFGYHWLVPGDPIPQAEWFLAHFTNLQSGEGVILDAEQSGITEEKTFAWCQHVENATGRPVAVYTGKYDAGGTIWNSARIYNGQRARWLAAYEPETTVRHAALPYGFDVWQGDGGETGTFPGVAAGVDLNMVENPIILDLACNITATAPPVVQPATPQPPIPQGDDVNAIMRVNEDGAVFLGVVNAQGAALEVSWSGTGDDPRTLPRIAAHRAAGAIDLPIPKAGLLNCTTTQPIPPGYNATDFFRVNG